MWRGDSRRPTFTPPDLRWPDGRSSFGAYLVHAPITVVLALPLREVGVPAEVKFLVVFALAVVASIRVGPALHPLATCWTSPLTTA
jgi:peptidoglycan/LPS O-acetylase OafA/YrhL